MAGDVLIVHGLGEHHQRYQHLAHVLCAQGWQVWSYDHHGHGASDGKRGDLPHTATLLMDLGLVIRQIKQLRTSAGPNAPSGHRRPLIVLGHSMGGLVAATYASEHTVATPAPWFEPIDALALSSPALGLHVTALQRLATAVLYKCAPHLTLSNGLDANWVSQDPAVVADYLADRLVHDRISAMLAHFMMMSVHTVSSRAPDWRYPTLLMWAGQDRCVNNEGSHLFQKRCPKDVLSARCFDPLYHEIFNEPAKQQVIDHLAGWLDRIAVRPQGVQ